MDLEKEKGRPDAAGRPSKLSPPPIGGNYDEHVVNGTAERANSKQGIARQDAGCNGDPDAAIAFLKKFHPTTRWALACFGPGASEVGPARTFEPSEEAAARCFLARVQGKHNVYFAVNGVGGKLTKKASKRDVVEIHYLHADVDLNKSIDWLDADAVAAEKVRVRTKMESYHPPPTVIVWSGGGFQAFWKLSEIIQVDGLKELMAPAERRMEQIEKTLGADACHNADRIMRLPGTLNVLSPTKLSAGRRPAMAELVEFHHGRIFDLEDFPEVARKEKLNGATGADDFERARNALTFISAENYDTYLSIAMALKNGFGEGAFSLYRHWAATCPEKFNEENVRTKWNSVKPDGGTTIATLFGIARENGWTDARRSRPSSSAGGSFQSASDWPDLVDLPNSLLAVAPFDFDMLPDTVRPWIEDVAERMQCPPDFVGATVMVGLGSVLGRKLTVRPKREDDWSVVPNLWGLSIGPPGVMKSPAQNNALLPLRMLSTAAHDAYLHSIADYEVALAAAKAKAKNAEREAAAKLKQDRTAKISDLLRPEQIAKPVCKRYVATNASVEALGELLQQNPNGVLVDRDEMLSLLDRLDEEGHADERGFFLSGWNGDTPYTFDRIGRGLNLHTPAVCLSMIGGTQPARISQYLAQVRRGGRGNDGLIQRFQLLVWPDISSSWANVDRKPNGVARTAVIELFERLNTLDWRGIGAKRDFGPTGDEEGPPYLRFSPAAHELFLAWRTDLEERIRDNSLEPMLEGHLAKYRSLVPALALITHLADGGTGEVGEPAVIKALRWVAYLESHAARTYASTSVAAAGAARAIVAKIQSGHIKEKFRAREIVRSQWSMLRDRETIHAALQLLVDHDWLNVARTETSGRPATDYIVNPKIYRLKR